MRINKFLAASDVASRRKSEELILSGKVTVNNIVIKDLSYTVDLASDIVKVENKIVKPNTNLKYIVLNKPAGYLSSTASQFGKQTVLDLLGKDNQNVYPVGRLDYNTKGLLVLTNDGQFTNNVIHPKNEIKKEYEVSFKGKLNSKTVKILTSELIIDDYKIKPAIINNIKNMGDYSRLNIIIHEGRNRQIRKMFDIANLKIIDLKRVKIGNYNLPKSLKEGQFKLVSKKDLQTIFE